MNRVKKVIVALVVLVGLIMTGLMMSRPPAFSQQFPDPKCVCASCGYPCGTGHAPSCPYYRP